MFKWFREKINNWRRKKELKKRLEELRKRDPFIYK